MTSGDGFSKPWIIHPRVLTMTQLTLFDTSVSSTNNVLPVPVLATAKASAERSPEVLPAAREGLNHMGDLAKLVLLRYELAAKRRAEAAARRRAR
jgi:hypothetical protein